MKPENELAMIVAFYLSKFGKMGLERLGYQSYTQAFNVVGGSLGVKPNSVKNWRDEFDPYYDNKRKGWYQREIRPSRQQVLFAFDNLSEQALRAIILNIIRPESRPQVQTELRSTLREIKDLEETKNIKKRSEYIPRGPTGRMAEEFFISNFHAGSTPFEGTLKDCRDDGVGFDFEVIKMARQTLIEIKGMAKQTGGITFTDKEWKVANEARENYFLGIVTHVFESPKIGFVQNPAQSFIPSYHAYTTVVVNWVIHADQLIDAEYI